MKSQPLGFLNGLDLGAATCLARLKRVSVFNLSIWRNKFRWCRLEKCASNRLRTILELWSQIR